MTRRSIPAILFALLACAVPVRAQQPSHTGDHSMAWGKESFLLAEPEWRFGARRAIVLDADLSGWSGHATRRWWYHAGLTTEPGRSGLELAAKHGWLMAPYWDFLVGAWVSVADLTPNGGATSGGPAIALHGLAPGWFEVEATAEVSVEGELALRATTSYDLYLTQRLVAQPRIEGAVGFGPNGAGDTDRSFSHAELGVRVRYEITRRFAPYAGFVWEREVPPGVSAALSDSRIVIGVRAWR
jgi:copper resistance protein B